METTGVRATESPVQGEIGQAVERPVPRRQDRPSVRVIPYDHVATFRLAGQPGTLHQDVVNVGVEGVFVAVAVGYGLQADATRDVVIGGNPTRPVADVTLADLPSHVLVDGLRLNPALEGLVFREGRSDPNLEIEVGRANDLGLFQSLRPRGSLDFSFLFSIVDTGTGRELQNAPVHSVAGLGKANGERPFRPLAKPLAFLPRSSIRIEVEEQTRHVGGRLHLVLQGYKVLGAGGVREGALRTLAERLQTREAVGEQSRRTIRKVEEGALPSDRVVPFDYARTLRLTGRPGNIVEEEIHVNVEGRYVATSIGYGLAVDSSEVVPQLPEPEHDDPSDLPLARLEISRFPSHALRGGFRIRPSLVRLAYNGALTSLPRETVEVLFEPLNLPDRLQFLYSIEDTGTGRAWQDEPVHSVAGLGISDGDRPFRRLRFPMDFLPRSTIRLRIEEIFGRGQLHIVFHGYKILSD